MEHLPKQKKKWNIYQFIGIVVLIIGVAITLQATQRSTEQRQFAQTPISYPSPIITLDPVITVDPVISIGAPSISPGQVSPTPSFNSPEKWGTRYAKLYSSAFSIRIGDQTFIGKEPIEVSSDSGIEQQTLEVKWYENNVEMRMYMYFRKKGSSEWELYELRTYNGQQQGDWIYYDVTSNPVSGYIGSYYFNTDRKFVAKNGSNAEIICKNCKIEALVSPSIIQYSSGYSIEPRIGLSEGNIMQVIPFNTSYSYAVGAVLYLNNSVVYDRSGIRFEWSSDSPKVVSAQQESISGVSSYIATRGIIKAVNFGTATITVSAIRNQDNKVLAASSFPVRAGESFSVLNTRTPECTLGVYADNVGNRPPNYVLTTPVQTVNTNEQIVLATNFFNQTLKQYQKMSYHIALGEYFQFVDSNGSNCSYNSTSKTITCQHGLFVNGGATSMAFRVKYTGPQPFPVSLFGTAFGSNGDTGSCTTAINRINAQP